LRADFHGSSIAAGIGRLGAPEQPIRADAMAYQRADGWLTVLSPDLYIPLDSASEAAR
jgi:hypothetical protein